MASQHATRFTGVGSRQRISSELEASGQLKGEQVPDNVPLQCACCCITTFYRQARSRHRIPDEG